MRTISEIKAREKLARIQSELKAPKNLYNNFGNYAYRNTSSILLALKPLLENERMELELHDTIVQIGERFYVRAIAKLIDLDTGISIESDAFAREQETVSGQVAAQITGAASTYARKYALNGLFLIDDSADDPDDDRNDQRNVKRQEPKQEAKPKKAEKKTELMITPAQIDIIQKNMSADRIASMCEFFKIDSIEKMTLKNASDTIKKLQKKESSAQ